MTALMNPVAALRIWLTELLTASRFASSSGHDIRLTCSANHANQKFHNYDQLAERARLQPTVESLVEAIHVNTARIEELQGSLEAVNMRQSTTRSARVCGGNTASKPPRDSSVPSLMPFPWK